MIYFFLFLFSILTSLSSYAFEGNIDNQTLSKLSLREKIGQLCFAAVAINETVDKELMDYWFEWQPKYQIDRQYVEKLIRECHIGGIVFYGKYAMPEEEISLNHHFQSISKIPLLVTIDAECGLGMRLNDKFVQTYPRNMTLGAIQNFDLIYQLGYEVGMQLKLLGVHINFAPVVDINNNPNNPVIGMRAFGSDKERVSRMGIAYMQGLQDAGIIACAKHFPGHGDTSVDSHLELPLIKHSLEHLYNNELYPFKRLIDAGIKSVMTAHLEIPSLENEIGLPSSSLSKRIVTDILQKEMGFNGLIFTDALGMRGVADHFAPGEGELKALLAGNDVLLCPLDVKRVIDRIEKAVLENEISIDEIDRKVLKVLAAKKWALAQVAEPEIDLAARLNSIEARTLRKSLYRSAISCMKSVPNFIEKFAEAKTAVINTDPELTKFEDTLRETSSFALLRHSFKERVIHLSSSQASSNRYNETIEESSNIIISVSKNSFTENSDQRLLLDLIQEIKLKGKNVTVVLFCSPYLFPTLIQADNIIHAYETAVDAQISVGELLCGIGNIEGILPIEL